MPRYILLLCLVVPLFVSFDIRADEPPPAKTANASCAVAADNRWTPQEKFVWSRACAGELANFETAPGYGGDLDPTRPEGFPDNRVLSSAFISTVLLADKYRHALTRNGLRIRGARFKELLDLRNAELAHELWLDRSVLEKGADFFGLRSARRITLDGTAVTGPLDMAQLRVDGDLSMRGSRTVGMNLDFAQVSGVLNLNNAEFSGVLEALSSTIGFVGMMEGRFTDVVLVGSHIRSHLVLSGSKVGGELDMQALQVDGNLGIVSKSEIGQVLLGNAHLHGHLSIDDATVHGNLDMTNLQLDGDMDMSNGSVFSEIVLIGAHVGDLVSLQKSKVTGALNMFSLHLGGSLDMSGGADFSQVILANAKIGGFVNLTGSRVHGTLDMYGLDLGGNLQMNDKAEFTDISLLDARIGGLLNLRSAKTSGSLNCESIQVNGDAFLGDGAEFFGPITFVFGKVGELELANATFHGNVDLTGAQIRSDLVLGSPGGAPPHWPGTAELILNDATVDAIQDSRDSWPAKIDLNGFIYRSLSGIFGGAGDRMADRPVAWFESWLARGEYSPQPYEQLAAVLRAGGRPDAADRILYVSKQNERMRAEWLQRVWLTALDWTVGYGFHVERALFWAAGFVLAGVIVLRVSGEGRKHGMPYGIGFSFDLLLPIIQLRKMHYDIDLAGWARYYFYLHKIAGYVLGSFLVVGVSGLVK